MGNAKDDERMVCQVKMPIQVILAFSNPILVRAIQGILGEDPDIILREVELSDLRCEDEDKINVVLCETEILAEVELEHLCLASRTIGISVWNNKVSISKGDLQDYDDLEEIIAFIKEIGKKKHLKVACNNCKSNV